MATTEELALGARIRALITASLGSSTWEGGGGGGGPATQLDADGTVLDVNVINDGEVLKRVGTTVVSVPVGAPGAHHLTHESGGSDQVSVAGLVGLLATAQTPIGHHATHAPAGSDPLAVGDLPAALITDVELAIELANYPDHATFDNHKARHQDGGADEINVNNLSGTLADPQPPIIGGGANQAVAGNDIRLTNARPPTAHAISHGAGGSDPIAVTEAQVTGLPADLAARALAGQLIGLSDPGSISMTTAFLLHYKRLVLSGAERVTATGASDVIVTDFGLTGSPRILGTPKSVSQSFTVPNDYVLDQLKRLTLCGDARGTLLGTADLVVTDDFDKRSRIVLAGRG